MSIAVAGRGEAVTATRADLDGEPALAAVRYADPAAWTTATAVARALASRRAAVLAAHDRVGVIVSSARGPVEAMAAMHEAARAGSSSPIRYPASNPGSLAGIASIAFALRGPTLMLTLPGDRGAPVAITLAAAWLARGVADFVVVAVCDGAPAARAILLARGDGEPLDRTAHAAWLAARPEVP